MIVKADRMVLKRTISIYIMMHYNNYKMMIVLFTIIMILYTNLNTVNTAPPKLANTLSTASNRITYGWVWWWYGCTLMFHRLSSCSSPMTSCMALESW